MTKGALDNIQKHEQGRNVQLPHAICGYAYGTYGHLRLHKSITFYIKVPHTHPLHSRLPNREKRPEGSSCSSQRKCITLEASRCTLGGIGMLPAAMGMTDDIDRKMVANKEIVEEM